jgi:membrane fusion protein (multidrug efflux system)
MIAYPRLKKNIQKDGAAPVPTAAAQGNQRRVLNINVLIMKEQSLSDKSTSIADIVPDEEVDLSFETSGKIVEITIKEGTPVKKGDLLAKINDQPLQAQLHKLEAQIPLTKDRVFRQRTLLDKDAVSQEAYEQVTTEYDKLMADIELVKANIAQTELRAPFDGMIGLRYISEGAFASPSGKIAKLTRISPIKIEFTVPEQYADDIVPGTNITFRMSGTLKEFHAQVYAVESRVDLDTRGLKARAMYPNTDGFIKPGRYASVELTKKEIKDALAVPSESLIQEMGKNILFLYKSGQAERTEVITGLRTESQIQIIQGLSAGDTVITSGVMQLRTGMPVIIDNVQ